MSAPKGDPGQRDGWCVHYEYRRTGPEVCAVGVHYNQFRPAHQPCFLDKGKPKPDSDPCEKLRLPTAEEIAAHEVWIAERMGKMAAVMTAIRPWRQKHKGRSHAEVIECPACKGRLRLSIAAYNGHVHGHCETPQCVSWME